MVNMELEKFKYDCLQAYYQGFITYEEYEAAVKKFETELMAKQQPAHDE